MSDKIDFECSFIWKIQNYSFCFHNTGENLRSPIFTVNNVNGSKWFLTFCPSYKEDGKEYISCFLNRYKEDLCDEEIDIYFKIGAINGNSSFFGCGINFFEPCHGGTMRGFNMLKDSSVSATNQDLTWNKDILTICCKIKTHLKRPEFVAFTEIGIDKCSFQWKLNFPDCVAAPQTKTFLLSETSQYKISLSAPNDLIEIKVKVAAEYLSSPQFLHGELFLLNQEAVKVLSNKAMHSFDLADGNDAWNFPSFITKKELKDYLKNDSFSLLCKFSATNGKESSGILSSSSCSVNKCNNALILQEDLSNLFKSMKYSDVELRSGNMTLPAHKSFLASRSPVFSAMFDQDMLEKQSGIVDISDIDSETLRSFIEFIYSGAVFIKDSESASKLLMVAEKYQVPSLKETCSIFLMSALSLGNVCDILELADMLNLKQLKICALDYFAKHMKEILNWPRWSNFYEKNAKLSMEMMSHVANNFEISLEKKQNINKRRGK